MHHTDDSREKSVRRARRTERPKYAPEAYD